MRALKLPQDFSDLLVELVDAKVELLLIGGWAMAVHGRARATLDMDVLVRPTAANASRVHAALTAFGAPVEAHGVEPTTFAEPGQAYRFGVPPLRVELLTEISGVSFDEAAREALFTEVAGRVVPVIGREALLRNKRAAGRHKDLDDVEWLEAARGDDHG